MRVAIVGCGLIGGKRARTLGSHLLVVASDVDISRANTLAARHPGFHSAARQRRSLA